MFTTVTFLNEPTNNLIIIMLICGIVGGVGNTLRSTTCSGVVLSKNICLGIIASIAVPLFLSLVSSDIISSLYILKKETDGHSINYLIFSGFCIIASYASLDFLNNISGRVIQNLKEESKQVKSEIEQLNKTVETIAVNKDSNTQITASELEKFKTLPYTEIMNSIKNKENKFRPLDLIKTEVNQDNTEIDKKIEILKNNNLVKEIELRKGEKAVALTEDAEKIME